MIGYDSQVDSIAALQASPHAPGAVLVVGPPLTGKTTVVMEAAKRITGSERGITVFDPDPEFADPNDEAVWKKEGVRANMVSWLRQTRMKPHSAGNRTVAVLLAADRLSQDASQLLLKATEDGLSHVSFLVTASSVDLVLPTIRSRAVLIPLAPMRFDDLAAALTERGIEDRSAYEYAVLSGGRPGLALQLAEDEELAARYRQWMRMIGEIQTMPFAQRSAFAAAWSNKEDAEEFLRLTQAVIHHRIEAGSADDGVVLLARRVREATSMMRHNISPQLALEYVLFTVAAVPSASI